MTLKQMIVQVFERSPDVVNAEGEDWGVVKQMVNAAMQNIYPLALRAMPWFYTKTHTFNSTSAATLPVDFFQMLLVESPGTNRGAVRMINHRAFETINRSSVQQGTASDPTAVLNNSTINFSPAVSGEMHFIWTFGFISDETTELTELNEDTLAFIPSMFEEDVIMDAIRMLRIRFFQTAEVPSEVETSLLDFTNSIDMVQQSKNPGEIYQEETPRPR